MAKHLGSHDHSTLLKVKLKLRLCSFLSYNLELALRGAKAKNVVKDALQLSAVNPALMLKRHNFYLKRTISRKAKVRVVNLKRK